MSIITMLESKKETLQKEISFMEKYLSVAPIGNISCYKRKNHTKWYLESYDENGKRKREYLPKSEEKLASKLALKKYYEHAVSEKKAELKCIDFYIKHTKPSFSESLKSPSSGYYELLEKPLHLSNWENIAYEKSDSHPEALLVKTRKNELVRSKSEAFIADTLYEMGIQYRYECALHIDDIVIHPDFTIIHPKTNEIYLWEHLGLMDKPSYVTNSLGKIPLYLSQNFMPGNNLIFTYESKAMPLNFEQTRELAMLYFG